MPGGSFLDTLLIAALGQLRVVPAASGSSVQALAGTLISADPTTASPTIAAPTNPNVGTYFAVADATAESGSHAINITSVGSAFELESPATAGSYANAVTIASASRVVAWCYLGSNPGWKIIWRAF